MTPVIFTNVSKYCHKKKILDNISFEINENNITAIIGRSGSGKSTILKIINGLVTPSSGEAKVFESEIDYDKLSELRLHIGYSVQGTALFPHMNVYDNITLLARLSSWDNAKIKERCEETDEGCVSKFSRTITV